MLERIIKSAKILSKIANKTPVMTSRTLNKELNCDIYFKLENFQRGGAFKFRGAFNAISKLDEESKKKGIITHSSGNHAQAVALNGKLLGLKTVIVMPENAPQVKVDATRGYGAKIVFSASSIESRVKLCDELIEKYSYTMIHPYDNQDVIEGAASVALELVEEVGDLDLIIAPIGGGGLISGTSAYAKLSGKIKRVIGAEPVKADDAFRSFRDNKRVEVHTPDTICDGLRTVLSDLTFGYIVKYVDQIITVEENEIVEALRFIWARMKVLVEPSSAVVLAALRKGIDSGDIIKGSRIGLIISGGNVNIESLIDQYNN